MPPNPTSSKAGRQAQAHLSLFLLLAAGGALATLLMLAYAPGHSSSIHFDDLGNLQALEDVEDFRSALAFVTSGKAGPTGRPIALMSYLPQADSWPDHTNRLIATNVWIHLLNALLFGVFAWLLTGRTNVIGASTRRYWVTLTAVAIWASMPLLASSSLFVIQRMTLLAASLVLLGLILHTFGRTEIFRRPQLGLSMMTAGAAIGLGLGILAKENAAIYPILILVLDRTLFFNTGVTRGYRIWRLIFVIIPAAVIGLYMLDRLVSGGGFSHRHFDIYERLFTQGVVLFDYLRLMVFPRLNELGPFHDHYAIYGGFSETAAILFTLFWVGLGIAALGYGPRWPVLAFGILWFLGAHLVESTWLSLELYFEHRNYLPAVGLTLALALALSRVTGRIGTVVSAGLIFYVGLMLVVLFQLTSTWGNPRVAAEIWWSENPDSVRAANYLAKALVHDGLPTSALSILDETSGRDPYQLFLPLIATKIGCAIGKESDTQKRYLSIVEKAPNARYVNRHPSNELEALSVILEDVSEGRCKHLDYADVSDLAAAFLTSEAVQSNNRLGHNYHALMARAAYLDAELETMAEHLVAAFERGHHLETGRNAAAAATGLGRADLLERIHVVLVSSGKTRSPFKRNAWKATTQDVAQRLDAIGRELRDTHVP